MDARRSSGIAVAVPPYPRPPPLMPRCSGARLGVGRPQRHGTGRGVTHSGDVYDGQWFADQREGPGVLVFANGDRFEGEFYRNQVRWRASLAAPSGE